MWRKGLIKIVGFCLVIASVAWAQEEGWKELNKKALKLTQEGKYAEAIGIAEKSSQIAEKSFGPDHLNFATSLNTLAEVYMSQGKYAQAKPLYKRSLPVLVNALGADHPLVDAALNNFNLCKQMTQKQEASECEECPQRIEPPKLGR